MGLLAPAIGAIGAWASANAGAIGIAAISTSAVGAGLSYYGSVQSAKTNMAIANRNAEIQGRNQNMQLQMGLAQAALDERTAKAQAGAQAAAAQAGLRNAEATREWADAAWRARAGDMEKQRRENMRLTARQRSKIAQSGLVETGSPLAVLAETAGQMQLDLEDQAWMADIERQQGWQEARNQEFEGRMGIFQAGMTRATGMAQAGLNANAARAGFANGMQQIRIGLAGSRAESSAMKWQAGSQLVGNLGSTAYMGYNIAYNKPRGPAPQAIR